MQWQRSSFCSANNCVEVANLGDVVVLRNSREPDKHLVVSADEWKALAAGVRAGEFTFGE